VAAPRVPLVVSRAAPPRQQAALSPSRASQSRPRMLLQPVASNRTSSHQRQHSQQRGHPVARHGPLALLAVQVALTRYQAKAAAVACLGGLRGGHLVPVSHHSSSRGHQPQLLHLRQQQLLPAAGHHQVGQRPWHGAPWTLLRHSRWGPLERAAQQQQLLPNRLPQQQQQQQQWRLVVGLRRCRSWQST
jgi:hypothetical protein